MFWHSCNKLTSCVAVVLLASLMTPATVLAGDAAESGDAIIVTGSKQAIARATSAYACCVSRRLSPHRSGRSGQAIQQRV